MSSPVPKAAVPKSGGYEQEPNSFSAFNDLFRFFQPRKCKISKNSPPVLNIDVSEAEWVWDRTLSRLYTVSNGALKYVAFS